MHAILLYLLGRNCEFGNRIFRSYQICWATDDRRWHRHLWCVCARYVISVFPHRYDLFFVVQCWLCGWLRLFFAGVEMNTIRKWLPSWKLMYASEIGGSTAVSMPRDVYSYVDMFVIVDMPINITILY